MPPSYRASVRPQQRTRLLDAEKNTIASAAHRCKEPLVTNLPKATADFPAASATNQMGLDLFRHLSPSRPRENVVLSPYSIASAMALAWAGADGATRTEMTRVLHFSADDEVVFAGFVRLRAALDEVAAHSRERAGDYRRYGGSSDTIEWRAANRLFGQRGYDFHEPFLTLMKDGYAAPFVPLDFAHDPEAARQTINAWIEEQTKGKIRQPISRGSVSTAMRLVLVNALHLQAPWENPFKESRTIPRPFHVPGGDAVDVATMHATTFLAHAVEDGVTIVGLPYLGGELQFLILLPDAGRKPEEIAAGLTPAHFSRWAKLDARRNPHYIALALPKFRVEGSTLPLGRELRALGMHSAFDEPPGSADFERIAPRKPEDYLFLSEVFHQTFIALDEEGTEAAAATVVVMAGGMARIPRPIEVRVDRPFLFAIQHRASGACLFLGRISDPR